MKFFAPRPKAISNLASNTTIQVRTLRRGFTLIELLIVIVIIGILATIGLPQLNNYLEEARYAKHLAEISQSKKETLAAIYASGKNLGEEELSNPNLNDSDNDNWPDNFYPYVVGGPLTDSGYTTENNFYFTTSNHASGLYFNGVSTGEYFIELTYRRLSEAYEPLRSSHDDWQEISNEADIVNRWYTRFVTINKTNLDSNIYLGKMTTGYAEYELDWFSVKKIK